MNRWTVLLTAMMFFILIACGCAGGNGSGSPAAPASVPEITGSVTGQSETGNTSLLGYYDVYFDIESQTMEVVENRSAAFVLNIVAFLNQMTTPPSGISLGNIVVDSSDPAVFKVDVDFGWYHPFPTLDQYKVYDFMGVIITDGDVYPGYTGLRRSKQGVNTYMTNADGYTRWYNPTEFTTDLIFGWTPGGIQNWKGNAHLNPYKAYGKGLTPTGDLWGWLEGGSNNDGYFQSGDGRLMQLEFPQPPSGDGLVFAYAAVCCWEEQGSTGPYTPYHRDEVIACKVVVTDDIYYVDTINQGGNLILDIDLWAWDEQPDVVKVESTVLTGAVTITDPPSIGGDHYSTYHLDVPVDAVLAGTEGHEYWIVAESTGYDYINIVGVAAPPDTEPLTAFFRYDLFVDDEPSNHLNVPTPTGPQDIWEGQTVVFTCAATDPDPGDTMTFTWSIVPTGQAANYIIPGDSPQPDTNTLTITMDTANGYPPGTYDISCQVQDSSGASNDTQTSPSPLTSTVYIPPYTGNVPTNQFDQVIVGGIPSLHGGLSCPWYWDGFYQAAGSGMVPFCHAEISILSGPSLGAAGVMVIADEVGAIVALPPPLPWVTGFAHFTCPFVTGNAPSWTWWTTGLTPFGPDMLPSVIHFDGNINTEFLFTNSQMTGAIWPVPDPSTFEHYQAWPAIGKLNDLYTSLAAGVTPDVAVDSTAGFDMGTPDLPDNPDLYGLYTQDWAGILGWCFGPPAGGVLNANPVNFLQFPSLGNQPMGTPVDFGGPGVVAPLPQALVSQNQGAGGGIFCIGPGGPCPFGALKFPEPFYALAIDDDPEDNPWEESGLPQPIIQWVLAATIDAERDLEIYEIDFGVAPPGPAPIQPWSSLTMGNFMGGNASAFPLDCEFISNFSDPGAASGKPTHAQDLLAVLLTDQAGGGFVVEIFEVTPGTPTSLAVSMLVSLPSMSYGVPGVAYRLDVDEVTGDIYVIHESAASVPPGGLGVTIFSY